MDNKPHYVYYFDDKLEVIMIENDTYHCIRAADGATHGRLQDYKGIIFSIYRHNLKTEVEYLVNKCCDEKIREFYDGE